MASNPPAGDNSPISTRPHSIDLTLELEHQLDSESLPNSPAYDRNSFKHQPFDPHVLASIITQLRTSVAEVTKERDVLLQAFEEATQKQAVLQENLQIVTDRSAKLEEQLSAAQDKHKDDEEAIAMLRTKVEESRRGLMRLQTESRRMSQLTIDSSARVNSAASPNKRMSLLINPPPNPHRGHRRISSQSDSGLALADAFQWTSPPPSSSALTDEEQNFASKEVQGLKQEIKTLKDTLEETKHELSEANEAREASEQCAKALRDYISEFRVGEAGPSSDAPPPPTTPAKGEDNKSSSKWSFKLWSGANSAISPSITPVTPLSPPPSSSALSPMSSPQPPALTRKIGSFFGSRTGSVSSAASFTTPLPTQEPSMYRASSDVSSVTEEEEPNSPYSDTSKAPAQVVIRQFTAASDVDGGSHAHENGQQPGDFVSTPTQKFPIAL